MATPKQDEPIDISTEESQSDLEEQKMQDEMTDSPPAQEAPHKATLSDVFRHFASPRTRSLLAIGVFFSALSGITIPGLVFFVSRSIKELSASNVGMDSFLQAVRTQSFALMGLGALAFVTQTCQSAIFGRVAANMTRSLKGAWFQALLRQDAAYYDRLDNVAGYATQLNAQAQVFQAGLGEKLGNGVQYSFSLVIALFFAFYSSWQTSLLVLATLPVVAVAMIHLFRINTLKNGYSQEQYATAGNLVYTTIASLKTILALDMMDHQLQQFQQATSHVLQSATKYAARGGMATGMAMASFLAIFLVVALYGTFLLYDQVRDNGCDPSGAANPDHPCHPEGADILGALLAIVMASWGLPQITDSLEGIAKSQTACTPALELLQDTDDDTKIDSMSSSGETPPSKDIQGNIQFNNVSFRYPTRKEQPIFHGLSLNIPAGSKVAFVGGSGSGKSTIIQLVMRLYDPDSGSITIDGHNLQDLNPQWLRNTVGLVGQEPVLFTGSIRDNICMGMPDATQEQIEFAARQANAHSFISQFPDGYDTVLQGQGSQLSGGQKQRIAIARCLIRDPKIIALDEATSALDSQSEQVVQQALDHLTSASSRTMLIVAHRLSTIKSADVIVVIKDGSVVEQGTHSMLLEQKGAYYDLVQAQQAHPVDPKESALPPAAPTTKTVATNSTTSAINTQTDENQPTISTTEALIEFKRARFAYPSRQDQTILRGLNLSIRKGETIGLCGPSGNGKSTLMQLIERFYDVSGGSVLFAGQDIREINPRSLRQQIGLVSQEPTLFAGTIWENIRFGNPSATLEEVEAAAKRANVHSFISAFPAGYNTEVGDSGTQMSGGQKQRIAIARALVGRPALILLDEATSALDSESEKVVQEALDEIMNDKETTVIVIAHRLSTITGADRIAVVSGGEVVELGSHNELMSMTGSLYSRLYLIQNLGGTVDLPEAPAPVRRQSSMGSTRTRKRASSSHMFRSTDLSGLSSLFGVQDESEEEQDPKEPADMSCSKTAAEHFSALFKRHRGTLAIGVMGEILASLVFPAWGLLLALMIEVLHTPVLACYEDEAYCQDVYETVAEEMQVRSFWIAGGCLMAMVGSMAGQSVSEYGFATAAERLTKEIRDEAFRSLLRQEPAYFDCNNPAALASLIEEDVSKINAMMGAPLRGIVGAVSSILVGLFIAFGHMWPVALLAIGVMPFKIFSASIVNKKMGGSAESNKDKEGTSNSISSGGLAVEVLSNIKTVASLSLEQNRLDLYASKLDQETVGGNRYHLLQGLAAGFAELVRLWVYALIFWFGGWVLSQHPEKYDFLDFLITMFVFLFSVSGLASSLAKLSERGAALEAACRVFALIDRRSQIDSLSTEGKPLE